MILRVDESCERKHNPSDVDTCYGHGYLNIPVMP